MPSGVELANAWVRLVPSAEGIEGGVAKALAPAEGEAEAAGKRSGSRFSAGAKAAIALGAAGIVTGLVSVFKTGMDELKLGETINAQTEQLIANTGFKGTVAGINDVTLALSQLSGISEEDLQSAGNNILKFGDVSEDTYNRAVSSINDLGASGKDVAGVSEALGKALADPAKAAALLKRQGVLLNDEQKALIDNFTAAGDKAGAQGVILDALESSYGGMAEATGGTLQGNLNKMQNAFENLAGDIVTMAMPAVTGIVSVLQGLVSWLSENQGVVVALAAIIGVTLVAAFIAWAASIWVTTVALLANPITWIILAIVALVAAIVFLILNWDAVWAAVIAAVDVAVQWIVSVFEGFLGWWNGLWAAVGAWVVEQWNLLVLGIQIVWAAWSAWIIGVVEGFVGWWNGIWAAVGAFIASIWNNFVAGVQAIWSGFQGWLIGVISGLVGWWSSTWSMVGSVIRDVFNGVVGFISGIWAGIVGTIRGAVNNIIGIINGLISGLNNLIGAAGSLIGLDIKIPRIPGLATGGTITRGGSVIVGERGPELLNLPAGASVNPDIAGAGGGGIVEAGPRLARLLREVAERPVVVQLEDGTFAAASDRGHDDANWRGGKPE